jgi:hypothetical protein
MTIEKEPQANEAIALNNATDVEAAEKKEVSFDGATKGEPVSKKEELSLETRISMYQTSDDSFINSSKSNFFEKSYHPGVLKIYNPPRQRQRWVSPTFCTSLVFLFLTF